MTTFQIVATSTGHNFGTYEGATPDDAIRAMLDDAGHAGPADADIVAVETFTKVYLIDAAESPKSYSRTPGDWKLNGAFTVAQIEAMGDDLLDGADGSVAWVKEHGGAVWVGHRVD